MNPFILAIITPDGDTYQFATTDPEQIDAAHEFLDARLSDAAAAGSLSAWWALEGRYRYRREQ